MLIDLEAGRPLEMPWLQGRVLELGRAHGIDTPANAAVVAALAPHAAGADGGAGADAARAAPASARRARLRRKAAGPAAIEPSNPCGMPAGLPNRGRGGNGAPGGIGKERQRVAHVEEHSGTDPQGLPLRRDRRRRAESPPPPRSGR